MTGLNIYLYSCRVKNRFVEFQELHNGMVVSNEKSLYDIKNKKNQNCH